MAFNGKAFLEYSERLLEPGVVVRGTQRRYTETLMSAKNRFFNQLTDADREQLRMEYEEEQTKLNFRS